ncbi:12293_t:CDS:2, partial [Racocetra fulgida]
KSHINLNVSNLIQSEQKEKESQIKIIAEERKILIQRAILDILKHSKTINIDDLAERVIDRVENHCDFKTNLPAIKKCVDVLLEKEYIECQEGKND